MHSRVVLWVVASLALAGCSSETGAESAGSGATEGDDGTSGTVDPTADSDTLGTTSGSSSSTSSAESDSASAEASSSETTDGGDDSTTDDGSTSDDCVPMTCAEMGFDCGSIFDGCGGTEECGSCEAPGVCGLAEQNVCGCEEAWVIEQVAFMDDAGLDTSMAVAPNGDIHIAYRNETDDNLYYAFRGADGGAWTNEMITTEGNAADASAIAVDDAGGVHVSYRRSGDHMLAYGYKAAGGAWMTETIAAGGWGSDLVLDGDGVVHISHVHQQDPYYAFGNFGAWTTESAAGFLSNFAQNHDSSLAVDEDGLVHMCVGAERLNPNNGSLMLRRLVYQHRAANGAWSRQILEGEGDGLFVGAHCDLELDAIGAVHIVHYDPNNQDLRYATNPAAPMGAWSFEQVANEGQVGSQPSLTTDAFGNIDVSHYDATNSVLLRSTKPLGGDWDTALLTDGSNPAAQDEVGVYSALVADDDSNLHVAFYEGGSGDLYYGVLLACPER